MTPLPLNPTVVVLVDHDNQIIQVASNVAELPELKVTVTRDADVFDNSALGLPFNKLGAAQE